MISPRLQKKLIAGGAVLTVSIICAFFLVSCQKAACSSCDFSSTNAASTGTPTSGNNGTTSTASGTFSLSLPANYTMETSNLGTANTVAVTVTADSNYSGTANLTITEPELAVLDPGQTITFSLSSSSVTLTPGQSSTIMVTINVSTMAPSFGTGASTAASLFHVQAADSASAYMTSIAVPLQVMAVYDVFLYGPATAGVAAPEKWSLAVGASVGFVAHTEGLSVNFTNMDSEVHLIHSDSGDNAGPEEISHESLTVPYTGTNTIGLPPSPNGGTTPGGTYTQVISSSTKTSSSTVYCHDHESGTQGRTFNFNQPAPAPKN